MRSALLVALVALAAPWPSAAVLTGAALAKPGKPAACVRDEEGNGVSGLCYPMPRHGFGKPPFPPGEIEAGHTGTVQLYLCIADYGLVTEIRLHCSSGYPALDETAFKWAREIQWIPASQDGIEISFCYIQPSRFA